MKRFCWINKQLWSQTRHKLVKAIHSFVRIFAWFLHAFNLGCPPSQDASHHQDYYIFSIGDPYKPSFATDTGRGDNPTFNLHLQIGIGLGVSNPPTYPTRCTTLPLRCPDKFTRAAHLYRILQSNSGVKHIFIRHFETGLMPKSWRCLNMCWMIFWMWNHKKTPILGISRNAHAVLKQARPHQVCSIQCQGAQENYEQRETNDSALAGTQLSHQPTCKSTL